MSDVVDFALNKLLVLILGGVYWWVTGDWIPAVLGIALWLLSEVWLATIVLSAAIIGLCAYFFWTTLVPVLGEGMDWRIYVTLLYMLMVFFSAARSFRM